jgi:hypothetical protein
MAVLQNSTPGMRSKCRGSTDEIALDVVKSTITGSYVHVRGIIASRHRVDRS